MTGNAINDKDKDYLDTILPNIVKNAPHINSKISLIHSYKEPTYDRDIKYLINDLNLCDYDWTEYDCGFEHHDEVGRFFIPIAKKILTEIRNKSI